MFKLYLVFIFTLASQYLIGQQPLIRYFPASELQIDSLLFYGKTFDAAFAAQFVDQEILDIAEYDGHVFKLQFERSNSNDFVNCKLIQKPAFNCQVFWVKDQPELVIHAQNGQRVTNAQVFCNQLDNQQPLSRDGGTYLLSCTAGNQFVKIKWNEKVLYIRNGHYNPNQTRSAQIKAVGRGYIALSKPRYRITDTLEYKAYLVDENGYPIKKGIRLLVKQNHREFIELPYVSNGKGSFFGSLAIKDSLSDSRCSIVAVTLEGKELARCPFIVSSKELDDYVITVKPVLRHLSTDGKAQLLIKTQHPNGWPARHLTYKLRLAIRRINSINNSQCHIPKEWFQEYYTVKGTVDLSGITPLEFPDSLFDFGSAEYHYHLDVFDPSGLEQFRYDGVFEKGFHRTDHYFQIEGDSVLIKHFDMMGTFGDLKLSSYSSFGLLESFDAEIGKKYALNPLALRLRLHDKDTTFGVYNKRTLPLNFSGYQTDDSIVIQSKNQSKNLFYRIYANQQLVYSASGNEIEFKQKSEDATTYYLVANYSEFGAARWVSQAFRFDDGQMTIQMNAPKVIWPGQDCEIEILATDAFGDPISGIDITAFANDARFIDRSFSSLPNLSKTNPNHIDVLGLNIEHVNLSRSTRCNGSLAQLMGLREFDSTLSVFYPGKLYMEMVELNFMSSPRLNIMVLDSGTAWQPDFLWIDGRLIYARTFYKRHQSIFENIPKGQYQVKVGFRGNLFEFDNVVLDSNKMTHLLFDPTSYGHFKPNSKKAKQQQDLWLSEAIEKAWFFSERGDYFSHSFRHVFASGAIISLNDQIGRLRYIRGYYMYPFEFAQAESLQIDTLLYDYKKRLKGSSDQACIRPRATRPRLRKLRRLFKQSPPTSPENWKEQLYMLTVHLTKRVKKPESTNLAWQRPNLAPEFIPSGEQMEQVSLYFATQHLEQVWIMHEERAQRSAVLHSTMARKKIVTLNAGKYYLIAPSSKGQLMYYDSFVVKKGFELHYKFQKEKLQQLDVELHDTMRSVVNALTSKRWMELKPRCVDYYYGDIIYSPLEQIEIKVSKDKGQIPAEGIELQLTARDTSYSLISDSNGIVLFSNLAIGVYSIKIRATHFGDGASWNVGIGKNEKANFHINLIDSQQFQLRSEINYPFLQSSANKFYFPSLINQEAFDQLDHGNLAITVRSNHRSLIGATIQVKINDVLISEGHSDVYGMRTMWLPIGVYTLQVSHISCPKPWEQLVEVKVNGLQRILVDFGECYHLIDKVVIVARGARSIDPSYAASMGLSQPSRINSISRTDIEFQRRNSRASYNQSSRYGTATRSPDYCQSTIEYGELTPTIQADYNHEIPELPIGVDSLRDEFFEVAYWQPNLTTNRHGKVNFTVRFPDNMVTWNNYVLAMYENDYSAAIVKQTSAYKPVITSLAVPRFLNVGDSLQGQANTYSFIQESNQSQLQIQANKQKIRIDSFNLKEYHNTYFNIKADSSQNGMELSASLISGLEKKDEVLYTIPVFDTISNKKQYSLKTIAPGDSLQITADEDLSVVYFIGPMEYAKSIMERLAQYRYGCVEQTSSKLLALLYEKQMSSLFGESFEKVDEVIMVINRLTSLKNDNGLWGWWSNQPSSPWMTIYATNALLMAKSNGFDVGDAIKEPIRKLKNDSNDMKPDLALATALMFENNNVEYSFNYSSITPSTLSLKDKLVYLRLRQIHGDDVMKKVIELSDVQNGVRVWGSKTYRFNNHISQTTMLALEILCHAMPFNEWYTQYMMPFLEHYDQYNFNTLDMAKLLSLLNFDGDYGQGQGLVLNGKEIKHRKGSIRLKQGENYSFFNKGSTGAIVLIGSVSEYESQVDAPFAISTSMRVDGVDVTNLKLGQLAQVEITVFCPIDYEKVMIEVPLPAGCVSLPNLASSSANEFRQSFDEQTGIFINYLSKGSHTFKIPIKAMYQGAFTMKPSVVSLMYFEDVAAQSASKRIMVNN